MLKYFIFFLVAVAIYQSKLFAKCVLVYCFICVALTDRKVTSVGPTPSYRRFAKSAIFLCRSFSIFCRSVIKSLCEYSLKENKQK